MNEVIITIVVLACIGLGVFLAPLVQRYLTKNNIDTSTVLTTIEADLATVGNLLINSNIKDPDSKTKANKILDIVTGIITELKDGMDARTDDQKSQIFYISSVKQLNNIGISLDRNDKDLINMIIRTALNLIKK